MNEETNFSFQILPSKLNKDYSDEFEIIESMSTFAHKSFLEQIKDEMKFYEMTIDMLSKSTQISSFRLGALINGNATFEAHEIRIIRNRLRF
jgi:hypothetical protein